MEEALVARLRADSAIASATATANGRVAVDWVERAADVLPYLVLHGIAAGRDYSHDGANALTHPLVQFDCWGSTALEAVKLERAVIAEMETAATIGGVAFTKSLLVNARDAPPTDLGSGIKVFGRQLDFEVWSEPAS